MKKLIIFLIFLSGCTNTSVEQKVIPEQYKNCKIISQELFKDLIIKDLQEKEQLDHLTYKFHDKEGIYFSNKCGDLYMVVNDPSYYHICDIDGKIRNFITIEPIPVKVKVETECERPRTLI